MAILLLDHTNPFVEIAQSLPATCRKPKIIHVGVGVQK
jgi:hypothetical protein